MSRRIKYLIPTNIKMQKDTEKSKSIKSSTDQAWNSHNEIPKLILEQIICQYSDTLSFKEGGAQLWCIITLVKWGNCHSFEEIVKG